MTTFIVFVIALSILVFVHEWGHFIVAKKCGIRVDIFSIGFGPKILGFTWHGTEYRIAPFPFGGFVKIHGQDPVEEAEGDPVKAAEIARDPQAFASKKYWQKMAVVLAGPVMNIILCFVIMPLSFYAGRMEVRILSEKPVVINVTRDSPAEKVGLIKDDLVLSLNGVSVATWKELDTQIMLYPNETVDLKVLRQGQTIDLKPQLAVNPNMKQVAGYLGIEPLDFYGNEPVIDSVKPGSVAEKSGFLPGDKVVSIDDKPIQFWTEMTSLIQKAKGSTLRIKVERETQMVEISATPEYDNGNDVWLLGITKKVNQDDYVKRSYSFLESIPLGFSEAKKLVGLTADVFKRLFSLKLSVKTLGGPLQIAQATSDAAKSGLGDFIYLLSFLSLQLGFMNLLPVPVLDGGHVVLLSIEALRRKPLSHKVRSASMHLGLVMLLTLMLFVTINDVQNLWGFANIFHKITSIF